MGFSVVRNHISITRGDSAVITLIIQNRVTGDVFMPSGEDKLTMTVKAAISDTEPVIVKTLGNGITNKDGVCELHIEPQDTRHLQCGVYVYDVELIMDGGYTDTIIPPSKFVITAEVTTHD